MEQEQLVAYCGLCDQRTRIPERAAALLELLSRAGFEEWGPAYPGFAEFWRLLADLAVVRADANCRSGQQAHRSVPIRRCARARGIGICVECQEYLCEKVGVLAASEPTMLHDGARLREIGVEAWLAEQEERRRAGFCYADVHCGRCTVPGKQSE